MFSLTSTRGSDPDHLHIAELRIQCALAKESFRHLSVYMDVVGKRLSGEPLGYSPIQIMSHGTSFLSAVATISKILFPADRSAKAKARGERLRTRIGVGQLPHIQVRGVRNSYEHIDERLDDLAEAGTYDTVCLVDITSEKSLRTLVLKKLDPQAGTIEFLGDVISIEGTFNEIQKIEAAL